MKYQDKVTITSGTLKGRTGTIISKVNLVDCTVQTDAGMIVLPVGAVRVTFKKGDNVKVIRPTHPLSGYNGIVLSAMKTGVVKVRFEHGHDGLIFGFDLSHVVDTPIPDTLAIPDDHVFEVKWRKLVDGATGIIFTNGQTCDMFPSPSTTHYLTESDLLKLKFEP